MRKNVWTVVLLIIVAMILSGCTIESEAEVVDGPLTGAQGVIARVDWNGSGTGRMSVTSPDGEVCGGRYFTGSKLGKCEPVFGFDMWAKYFGSQFDPWMMQRGAGILTGDSGRVIMVEYFVTITNVGYGLGEDNYGNIYRFVIRP